MNSRKVPFSVRQKKAQLKQKRIKKQAKLESNERNQQGHHCNIRSKKTNDPNERAYHKGEANPGRYKLNFLSFLILLFTTLTGTKQSVITCSY